MSSPRRRTCPTCGHSFETVLTGPDVECGLGDCPSARPGSKPPKTTARGRPIDDRKAKASHRRPTSGAVQQRSTGFDLLDGCLPALVVLALAGGTAVGVATWGVVELVHLLAVLLVLAP